MVEMLSNKMTLTLTAVFFFLRPHISPVFVVVYNVYRLNFFCLLSSLNQYHKIKFDPVNSSIDHKYLSLPF
jgi:hypothetical protein